MAKASDTGTRGFIPTQRHTPWSVALDAYRSSATFRGFLEFALIGTIVLWFLSAGGMGSGHSGSLLGGGKPRQQASDDSPSVPFAPPEASKPRQPDIPLMPRIGDVKIEPSYFKDVAEPLRGKLIAALKAYSVRDNGAVTKAIADVDPDNPHALLLRGLNLLSMTGPGSVDAGVGLLERAAERDEPRAMAIVGILKISGVPGVPRDNTAGRALLERAVAAGDAPAARVMGEGFITGSMGVVDPGRAEQYLRLASDRGDVRAMFRLGQMLYFGFGLSKNESEGERLVTRAANENHAEAQAMLGMLRLIPYAAGLTDDPDEALRWLERSSAQDQPQGMLLLGTFYVEYGRRTGRLDLARGVDLYRQCAQKTLFVRCLFSYGFALEAGLGTDRNLVTAYAMYTLAKMQANNPVIEARRNEIGKQLSAFEKQQANAQVLQLHGDARRRTEVAPKNYVDRKWSDVQQAIGKKDGNLDDQRR